MVKNSEGIREQGKDLGKKGFASRVDLYCYRRTGRPNAGLPQEVAFFPVEGKDV